jgi:hypothetical protein
MESSVLTGIDTTADTNIIDFNGVNFFDFNVRAWLVYSSVNFIPIGHKNTITRNISTIPVIGNLINALGFGGYSFSQTYNSRTAPPFIFLVDKQIVDDLNYKNWGASTQLNDGMLLSVFSQKDETNKIYGQNATSVKLDFTLTH